MKSGQRLTSNIFSCTVAAALSARTLCRSVYPYYSKPVGGVVLLGGFRIVRLEPVHHLLLVELGAHSEHGVGEAASDLHDSFRRKLVENAYAHLNRVALGDTVALGDVRLRDRRLIG